MATLALWGPLATSALNRTAAAANKVDINANTHTLVIQHASATHDLLFFVSPTDVGALDLNTIPTQCTVIAPEHRLVLEIGEERLRPSSGFMYANYVTGGGGFVNFGQIVGIE